MTAATTTVSLHDTVSNRIIEELEQGCFPWVQPWASSHMTPLGLPMNASTGRAYSGINILLLWFAAIEQGRPSQRWLTFKQALAMVGNVRKGEKGTMVVYAHTFVPRAEQEKAARSGEEPRRVGFLKRFTVFHTEQCDGLPPDPEAKPLPGRSEIIPHVETIIAATRADIRIGGEMAFYAPGPDFIQVPPQQAYFEPVNWYRTKLHELGHNAERRIMPRGEASALRTLASCARLVSIVFLLAEAAVGEWNDRLCSGQSFRKAVRFGNLSPKAAIGISCLFAKPHVLPRHARALLTGGEQVC